MKSDDGSGGKSLLYRIWNSTKAKAGAKEASSRETIEEIFGLNKETTRTPDADTTQKSEGENIEQDVEQSPGSDTKQSPGADVEQSPGADVEQSSETVMEQGPGLEPTVEDAPDSEPEPKDQHPHGDIMKIKHNYLEAIRSGIELTDMIGRAHV